MRRPVVLAYSGGLAGIARLQLSSFVSRVVGRRLERYDARAAAASFA